MEVEVDRAAGVAPRGGVIAPRPAAEATGAGVAERQGEGETVRPAAPRQEGAAADVLQAVEDGGAQAARLENLPLPLAVGRGAGRLRRWRTSTSGTNTKIRTRAVSCTPCHIGRLRSGLAQSRQPGKKRRRRKEGVVWGNRLTHVWESSSLADKQRSSTLPALASCRTHTSPGGWPSSRGAEERVFATHLHWQMSTGRPPSRTSGNAGAIGISARRSGDIFGKALQIVALVRCRVCIFQMYELANKSASVGW